MSKTSEMSKLAGAWWMLEYCEKHGLKAARRELEYRSGEKIPLAISEDDIRTLKDSLRNSTITYLMTIMVATLYDEFDFSAEDCCRFVERYTNITNCIGEGRASVEDYRKMLKDELDIELEFK